MHTSGFFYSLMHFTFDFVLSSSSLAFPFLFYIYIVIASNPSGFKPFSVFFRFTLHLARVIFSRSFSRYISSFFFLFLVCSFVRSFIPPLIVCIASTHTQRENALCISCNTNGYWFNEPFSIVYVHRYR